MMKKFKQRVLQAVIIYSTKNDLRLSAQLLVVILCCLLHI